MTSPTPPVDLAPLEKQLADAGYDVSRGIGLHDWPDDPQVYTYDADGAPEDLPSEAQSIVDAFLDSLHNAA